MFEHFIVRGGDEAVNYYSSIPLLRQATNPGAFVTGYFDNRICE
jgi:hypothetical protein